MDDDAQPRKSEVLNIRAEASQRRSRLEHALARVSRILSHPLFFGTELAFHVLWVALNSWPLPGLAAWDPYPFPLLTGLASAQALFIGLLVLMYATREERVEELRDELDLQVALHIEYEASRLIQMVHAVQRALGVEEAAGGDVEDLKRPIDPRHLAGTTERRLAEIEKEEKTAK